MDRIIKHFFFPKKPEKSLITVEVNKKNIFHNLSEFQKLSGCIAPVLKSNAYGHGLLEVARILDDASVPFFVVDSYFEAHTLRYNNIKKPIVIIGYSEPDIILNNKLKHVSFVITSLDQLKKIANIKNETSIHIKVDTGMRRQGILPSQLTEAISIVKRNNNIFLDGICTHFSDADNKDKKHTQDQIKVWNKVAGNIKETFPETSYFHVSNTAGHIYLNNVVSNVSRLGIGLYGLDSGGEVDSILKLKPVMRVKTKITGIKELKKDETSGYGNTFKAKKDMTIATIPYGYFEGMQRKLSNKGYVKIQGTFVPIIGTVSMNITVIDVSKIDKVKIGDEVEVVSNKSKDKNSIRSISKQCKTIPYVLAVGIERGLKREAV